MDALLAFDQTLDILRGAPSLMNIGLLSTDARTDAYNYLYVTGLIPEPGTVALLGLGLLGLAARRRRHKA